MDDDNVAVASHPAVKLDHVRSQQSGAFERLQRVAPVVHRVSPMGNGDGHWRTLGRAASSGASPGRPSAKPVAAVPCRAACPAVGPGRSV